MRSNTAPRRRIRGTTRPLVEAARLLRRDLTPAERVLWDALQGRQLAGLRFRNQHAIGPYVADFFCPAAKLIVEVDGSIHDQQVEQDAARTDYLAALARIEQAALTVPPNQRLRKEAQTPSRPPRAPATPQA